MNTFPTLEIATGAPDTTGASFILCIASSVEAAAAFAPSTPVDLELLGSGATPGKVESTLVRVDSDRVKVGLGLIPTECNRHNCPIRPDSVTAMVSSFLPKIQGARLTILFALDDPKYDIAAVNAVSRSIPLYNSHMERAKFEYAVKLVLSASEQTVEHLQRLADNVRAAAALVDAPTSEMNCNELVAAAEAVAAKVGASVQVIRGRELEEKGYGGLWGVGKGSSQPPALVILSHEPAGAEKTVCLVGKGITFDTGGNQIKPTTAMPGMKRDMGGSAGILHAFSAAVAAGYPNRLHALLCVAENSVDGMSFRPDDVLYLYSGLSVEINHTDAEGRLVLGDGVAHAVKHLNPDAVVTMATLTGAQGVSTGKRHAALVSNCETLESNAVVTGRFTGDLCHPLLFCPEMLNEEFASEIADMKNSVGNSANAGSSCAANFIARHMGDFLSRGKWIHVDIAYPSFIGDRGSGYGVSLLSTLLLQDKF